MRKWVKGISPAQAHDQFGLYQNGQWIQQMDRCWESDDRFSVCSRLIDTEWGQVEHVTISRRGEEYFLSQDGKADIPWKIKQEIKDELFGEKRLAIEVFPKKKNLVDTCDVYHLWVFAKDFELPFGISPKDTQGHWHQRGYSFNAEEAKELEEILGIENNVIVGD